MSRAYTRNHFAETRRGWNLVDVELSPNGGYTLVGYTESTDGDVSFNDGGRDTWLVSIDDTGKIISEKTNGGSGFESGITLNLTSDHGILIGSDAYSSDGDLTNSGYHGGDDIWLLKLDSLDTIQWSKCYGGFGKEYIHSVSSATDSGYIIGGLTYSNNSGQVTANHGYDDYWIIKIDQLGNLLWQKCLGGSDDDQCFSVIETNDQGILAAGYTMSQDGDVTYNHSDFYTDAWLVKLNSSGEIQWEYSYGGYYNDAAWSVIQLPNSGYIFVGSAWSNDGDITSNNGLGDFWIVQLSASTLVPEIDTSSYSIFPNPAHDQLTISFPQFTNNARLIVRNQLGQEVISQSVSGKTVDLSLHSLSAGIYIVTIQDGRSVFEGKFVKE